MLGCDLSPPLLPLDTASSPVATATPGQGAGSPSPTPGPTATPVIKAIRGYVVDRNDQRLPGVKVALGSLSVQTAEASASATDELGQAVLLEAGEFILLRVPGGDQTLILSYDDATRSLPVTVKDSGVTRADGLYLPVYGAVPSGSKALVANTSLPLIKVQKASADAQLLFAPEVVSVTFKAPPNGIGDQIGAYSITYMQDGGTALAPPVVRTLSLVDVPPALSATKSGPSVTGNFYLMDSGETLRSAWTLNNANAYVRIEFFNKRDGRRITDRNGDPLFVEVSCTLVS